MGKNMKFSAFKLFYDEFVYKKNSSISYNGIDRNIDEIRNITMEIRKTPKFDIDSYMERLNRLNKRLKEQLEAILKINKSIFEFYLIIHNFVQWFYQNLSPHQKQQERLFFLSSNKNHYKYYLLNLLNMICYECKYMEYYKN